MEKVKTIRLILNQQINQPKYENLLLNFVVWFWLMPDNSLPSYMVASKVMDFYFNIFSGRTMKVVPAEFVSENTQSCLKTPIFSHFQLFLIDFTL